MSVRAKLGLALVASLAVFAVAPVAVARASFSMTSTTTQGQAEGADLLLPP